MRIRYLLLAPALILGACSSNTSPTDSAAAGDLTSIVPDFANSAAAMIDPAGIGGAQFPDSLALTVEQKATIDSLHAAFEAATAADVAALQSIQSQARAAHQAGKSNADVGVILAQAVPILTRLYGELTTLQNNIAAVYTSAQKAWIMAHQFRACGPGGPPTLTDDQMQQIKALQDAFTSAVKNDVAFIRQIADSAHEAERVPAGNARPGAGDPAARRRRAVAGSRG